METRPLRHHAAYRGTRGSRRPLSRGGAPSTTPSRMLRFERGAAPTRTHDEEIRPEAFIARYDDRRRDLRPSMPDRSRQRLPVARRDHRPCATCRCARVRGVLGFPRRHRCLDRRRRVLDGAQLEGGRRRGLGRRRRELARRVRALRQSVAPTPLKAWKRARILAFLPRPSLRAHGKLCTAPRWDARERPPACRALPTRAGSQRLNDRRRRTWKLLHSSKQS